MGIVSAWDGAISGLVEILLYRSLLVLHLFAGDTSRAFLNCWFRIQLSVPGKQLSVFYHTFYSFQPLLFFQQLISGGRHLLSRDSRLLSSGPGLAATTYLGTATYYLSAASYHLATYHLMATVAIWYAQASHYLAAASYLSAAIYHLVVTNC